MKKFYSVLGMALVALAATTVSAASWFAFIYQPKAPKTLQKGS